MRSFLASLYRLLRPYRGRFIAALLLLGGEVVTDLLKPWPIKFVIDYLTQHEGKRAIVHVPFVSKIHLSEVRFLVLISAAILLITLAEGVFSYFGITLRAKTAGQIGASLRCRLFAHVKRLHLDFHYTRRTGDLINRVVGDVGVLEDVVANDLTSQVAAGTELAAMTAVLLWMDWKMTLAALALAPLIFWVTSAFRRRIKNSSRTQRRREGNLASIAQETFSSILLIKAFSREAFVDDLFERENKENLKATLATAAAEARLLPVVQTLMAIGVITVVCFGVVRVRGGVLSTGDLWIFLSYLRGLKGPVKELSRNIRRLSRAQVRWERVSELLQIDATEADETLVIAPRVAGAISIQDVDFSYAERENVLLGVNMEVRAGERVALIGPTGSGKSTLVSLIAGLHTPTRGTVRIDGLDLRTLRPDSIRDQIAFVLQETVLFRTSLRENIAYGRLDASLEEIVAAAKAARIHDFIAGLPRGYETIVGERGATLSGGQRQRIAIARAILRKARILILDEPTTGLDPITERDVWQQLKALMAGSTTLLISHNSRLALDMDKVFNLVEGRLQEAGHAEGRPGKVPKDNRA